jgi:hypothetical protein
MMDKNHSNLLKASLCLILLMLARTGICGQSPTEAKAAKEAEAKNAEDEIVKRGGVVNWPKDADGSPNYKHGDPYYDPIALKYDYCHPEVRLRNVELTEADLVELVQPLKTINPRALNIRFTAVRGVTRGGQSVWDSLDLPALHTLNLSSTLVDGDGGLALHVNGFKNLKHLWLDFDTLVFDELLRFIGSSSQQGLHLHLSHVQMRDPSGKCLEADAWFERLVRCISNKNQQCNGAIVGLDVSYTHLTDPGLAFLKPTNWTQLQGLSELSFAGNEDVTNEGLSFLPHLSRDITKINLSDTALNDKGLLDNLAGFTRLTSLSLANTKVTDLGIAKLLSLNLYSLGVSITLSLTDLNLAGTHTMSDLVNCSRIGRMKKLRSLDLEGTGINDDGLREMWESGLVDASRFTKKQQDEIKGDPRKVLEREAKDYASILPLEPPKRFHGGVLNTLNLNKTQVTDKGLIDVDQKTGIEVGARFPHVQILFKDDTKITDGGLNHWEAVRARRPVPHVVGDHVDPPLTGPPRLNCRDQDD